MRYRKKMNPVVFDIPDDTFSGVYALVDENGKMYIGSSVNIRRRVIYHNCCFLQVKKENRALGLINSKLNEAVLCGHSFHVKILEKVECKERLWDRELYHIEKNGGIENLYNCFIGKRK